MKIVRPANKAALTASMLAAGNKKIYLISGAVLLGAIIIAGFILYTALERPVTRDGAYEFIAESNGMVLMADVGLDIEWLEEERGRRQVFERYRIVSREHYDSFSGDETLVDSLGITQDNAEVFLTYPDKTRENIASDVNYIRFSIYPFQEQAGRYKLDVKLNSGEEYNFAFTIQEPVEVALTDTGERITQQKPNQQGEDILSDRERLLLNSLEATERESRDLHAFQLGEFDLRGASSVFHITPEGGVYGGALAEARELVYIDEYFWIDYRHIESVYEEGQQFIAAARGILNPDPDVVQELERLERDGVNEHVFLAKINGVWHYAAKNFPF